MTRQPYTYRLPGPRLQLTEQRPRLSPQGPAWWQQQAAREWPDVTQEASEWPLLLSWVCGFAALVVFVAVVVSL